MAVAIQCAQLAPPQGGPKDEKPPTLDVENSTPNFQTNFTTQDIILYFDEYVEVRDAFKQILISPPLDNLPKVTARLKKVTFEFPEGQELKDNATYTINFGNSIRDFTEGNTVKDFRYVFSTGDYIDSLTFAGTLRDAYEGTGVGNAIVMLYDNFADSVVYNEKPFYFATTDDNGNFKFENLRADSFKIFGLEDGNINYIYDLDTERIAFSDQFVSINDSVSETIDLEMFLPIPEAKIIESDSRNYGRLAVLFNKEPIEIDYTFMGEVEHLSKKLVDDSLVFYFNPIDPDISAVFFEDSLVIDTVKIAPRNRDEFLNEAKLGLQRAGVSSNARLAQNQPLKLRFTHPLNQVDTSQISLTDTSGIEQSISFEVDTLDREILYLNSDWKVGDQLALNILPNAISDIYNRSTDTIEMELQITDPVVYGKIVFSLDSLDSRFHYIVKLFSNNDLKQEETVRFDTTQIITFDNQFPGKYDVQIIEDRNFNGRWDPGNYELKEQSEEIIRKSLGELRADWEMNESLNWKRD